MITEEGLDVDSYSTLQDLSLGGIIVMVFSAAVTPTLFLWLWLGDYYFTHRYCRGASSLT